MSERLEVTVVGAGVIGLATARLLAADGHRVRVVADRAGVDGTSGAAGAIWYPYLAEPLDRVAVWAAVTYRWLTALARDRPAAGVPAIVPLYLPVDDRATPRWEPAVPPEADLRFLARRDLPPAARVLADRSPVPPAGAWVFESPVVDPARHLAWLARGLDLEISPGAPVVDLDSLPGDRVVCCAGPRAGRLVDDPELAPTLGQLLETTGGSSFPSLAWADERDPEHLAYAFARGDEVILGGCNLRPDARHHRPWEAPDPPPPDAELSRQIAERWRRRGVDAPAGARARAGWRPVRTEVRVERHGRLIYNYGHGGAGFTLARGTAEEVARLVAG